MQTRNNMSCPSYNLNDDFFTTLLNMARNVIVEGLPQNHHELAQLAKYLPQHPYYANCFRLVIEHPLMTKDLLTVFHHTVVERLLHLAHGLLLPELNLYPSIPQTFHHYAWNNCFQYIQTTMDAIVAAEQDQNATTPLSIEDILSMKESAAARNRVLIRHYFLIGMICFSQLWWDPRNISVAETFFFPQKNKKKDKPCHFACCYHRERVAVALDDDNHRRPKQVHSDRLCNQHMFLTGWRPFRLSHDQVTEDLQTCIEQVVTVVTLSRQGEHPTAVPIHG